MKLVQITGHPTLDANTYLQLFGKSDPRIINNNINLGLKFHADTIRGESKEEIYKQPQYNES